MERRYLPESPSFAGPEICSELIASDSEKSVSVSKQPNSGKNSIKLTNDSDFGMKHYLHEEQVPAGRSHVTYSHRVFFVRRFFCNRLFHRR